jgi:hypothetical protein
MLHLTPLCSCVGIQLVLVPRGTCPDGGMLSVLGSEFITKSGKKLFDPCTDHDSVTIAELTTHYTRSQLFRNSYGSVVCNYNCWATSEPWTSECRGLLIIFLPATLCFRDSGFVEFFLISCHQCSDSRRTVSTSYLD